MSAYIRKMKDGSNNVIFPATRAEAVYFTDDSILQDYVSSNGIMKKSLGDKNGKDITTYLSGLSVSGKTITYTKGDGTSGTITTQDTTYSAATTSAAGLMSATDKKKLDGIAEGANKYTHPSYTAKSSGLYKVAIDATGHVSGTATVTKSDITALGIPGQDTNTTYDPFTGASSGAGGSAGLVPAPNAGDQAKYLRADGTWNTPTNTTYSTFKAASSSAAGGTGLVPAPAMGAQNKYLRGDATWQTPPNTTYSNATTSADGLMSSEDKTKLDGIATGANKTVVDTALSSTSTNPVQNKVINTALAGKASSSHTHQNFTISLNGASQGAYNGSAAKSINITPSSIGAATASHTHSGFVTIDSSWGSSVSDIP